MNFFTKALLKSQLKSLPKDQQEMIMALVEQNPKLFTQIAKEVKEKQKKGLSNQAATMQVMMAHKNELQKLAQNIKRS